MDDREFLTRQFETQRGHLRTVAYRMLSSLNDADDAVQEAWIRLNRNHRTGVENLNGWLTTVVARVCMDMLRQRKARREYSLHEELPGKIAPQEVGIDPEEEAVVADSVGLALLVVLDALTPAERVAYVLHDMFDLPFDEIGPILHRSEIAARKLASRARRRVHGAQTPDARSLDRRREVVEAFMAASREGNFRRLLSLLDPEVVLTGDGEAIRLGSTEEVTGAQGVARTFATRARAVRLALVDGSPAMVWASGDALKVVFLFTLAAGRIARIDLIADPDHLERLAVEILDG
ncbi:MAG TPA: sigma-70 family RNA polymerase sigma factor [Candidatus Dormibacteraeota bacterium]|nr:sigma-70 family RNA polymerase sigma factor [Candidatus Dormibacteraeota bacterium]